MPCPRSALLMAAACAIGPAWGGEIQNRCKPVVVAERTVQSSAQIVSAGAKVQPPGLVGPTGFDWNDTQLGVLRAGDGRFLFFASDGSCHRDCNRPNERDGSITRTVGTLDQPLGTAPPIDAVLPTTLPPDVQYIGGGPAWRIPREDGGHGTILLVYHAERPAYLPGYSYPDCNAAGFCNGQQRGIYSYLGLARSTDEGRTWHDMGLILSANTPYGPQVMHDIGDGDLVIERHVADPAERFIYVYFPDLVSDTAHPAGVKTVMSVARVRYDSLVQAAAAGARSPAFRKYHNGAWAEPGLGGASTDVLAGVAGLGHMPGNQFDMVVAWNKAVGRYAAILGDTHTVKYLESPDALHWSAAVELPPHIDQNTQVANYATPVGLGRNPHELGAHFAIYYNFQKYYGTGAGWPSAQLRRMDVACRGPTDRDDP